MENQIKLFVTLNFTEDGWDVWFEHPLGGRNILNEESFLTEEEAEFFKKDQEDNADLG
jgi:hypothetical protein